MPTLSQSDGGRDVRGLGDQSPRVVFHGMALRHLRGNSRPDHSPESYASPRATVRACPAEQSWHHAAEPYSEEIRTCGRCFTNIVQRSRQVLETVFRVKVIKDPGGNSLRMGDVEMSTPREAERAVQKLHRSYLQGGLLLVFEDIRKGGSTAEEKKRTQ